MRLLAEELKDAGVDESRRRGGLRPGAAAQEGAGMREERIVRRLRGVRPGQVLARPLHALQVARLGRARGQGHSNTDGNGESERETHTGIIARERQGHKVTEVTQ